MPHTYLIGVDLGTSATKAALYQPDGILVAEAVEEVPLHYPAPGVVEQDQEDFYTTAANTVRQVITDSGIDPNEIAAIGFGSQMAGIGAVTEGFVPAIRFDSWLDMRCQPYIEAIAREHGDLVTELTGCPPTCAHAAKMLWWQHEQPEHYRRITKFLVPAGYVGGRLAGIRVEEAFIDYSFLHFTGCADSVKGTWSDALCHALGIDRHRLPRIVKPWDVIGGAVPDQASAFGLPAGMPVVAGAGDTAASALGAGIVRPGMMLDVAGTASVLAGCTDRFAPDVRHKVLLVMRSIVPGLWHPLAYIGGGGLALDWFREKIAGAAGASLETLADEAAYVPPGAEGLFFSPHLGGRICPADPARRGTWQGFSWGHSRAHFFRSILESIAFEYASYLQIIEELIPHIERSEARIVGGGARSAVWNQIKADVLGVPYRRLPRTDIATWGVALVAGHAVGLIPDIPAAAARSSEPEEAAFAPSPTATATYRPIIQSYIDWQRSLDRP
jgi:xylulokinase